MKSDTLYKRAFNMMLALIADAPVGSRVPSETELSSHLGVSRSPVRKALRELEQRGIVDSSRIIVRTPQDGESYPDAETVSVSAFVEMQFLERVDRSALKPGEPVNTLELARQFGVSTTGVREFLQRFERLGLIERRPSGAWIFNGITSDFMLEWFEIRLMFELHAAKAFAGLPPDSPNWEALREIRAEQERVLVDIEVGLRDYPEYDVRLHPLVVRASDNRYITDFCSDIVFLFRYLARYYYRRQENQLLRLSGIRETVREHIDYIDALFSLDAARIETALRTHLSSALAAALDELRASQLAADPPVA